MSKKNHVGLASRFPSNGRHEVVVKEEIRRYNNDGTWEMIELPIGLVVTIISRPLLFPETEQLYLWLLKTLTAKGQFARGDLFLIEARKAEKILSDHTGITYRPAARANHR